MSWSGGKDSALSLYRLMEDDTFDVVSLHTTIDTNLKRVGLHGIHESIIEAQADVIGLPLTKLYLDPSGDHGNYNRLIKNYCEELHDEGVRYIGYGDIFLEDLKNYRDKMLATAGLAGVYPLWKNDTTNILEEFWKAGFETLLCSADAQYFSENDLGAAIDSGFVSKLMPKVDPCGENGEFHSVTIDGPIFNKRLELIPGERVLKTYDFKTKDENGQILEKKSAFWFLDFELATAATDGRSEGTAKAQ